MQAFQAPLFCFPCRCNEELDDKVVIKRLKQRVTELEREVEQLKGGHGSKEVSSFM